MLIYPQVSEVIYIFVKNYLDVSECTLPRACPLDITCNLNTDVCTNQSHCAIYTKVQCPVNHTCVTLENTCHINASCSNMQGSFDCACNSGFSGTGHICSGE